MTHTIPLFDPADCDRTTVYTGECRNFADTAWVRFDSGRRRASKPANGRAWLVDYGTGSYWCRDDQVRNLVPLVPAPTRADIDRALINVTSNAMNYPDPVQILGKDTGPLRSKCVDAICHLLGTATTANTAQPTPGDRQ